MDFLSSNWNEIMTIINTLGLAIFSLLRKVR